MITYSNIKRFDNLQFDEYLKIQQETQAYSFSFMKREKFGQTEIIEATDKMRRGTLVDNILTDPGNADYNSPLYAEAKAIAATIKQNFGAFIRVFEKQVSFTANMEHKGHIIPTTGRIDFGIPKHAVIDLKVTGAKNVREVIHFMNYKEQLWHYCNMYGVKKGYIMIYSTDTKKVEIIDVWNKQSIPERSEFWESKVLKFGVYERNRFN